MNESVAKSTIQKIDSLTGLRIFAAVWVMLFHFRQVTPEKTWSYPGVDWLLVDGGYGVELFFVLSGYIMMYVYGDRFRASIQWHQVRDFLAFRVARLYPVHVATFLIMAALYVGQIVLIGSSSGESSRYSLKSVITTLTMTHAWFGVDSPNMPSWSISAEWFAYLLFPFLCWAIFRHRFAWIAFAAAGLAFAGLWTTHPYHLLHIAAGFPIGMALFQVRSAIAPLCRCWTATLAAVVVVVIVTQWGYPAREQAILVAFAALIVALTNERDWLARVLGTRVLVYLGEISFAVYMFHWVARVIVRIGLEKAGLFEDIPSPAIVALYIAATFVGAVAIYHLIEVPSRARLRSLLTGQARARTHELEGQGQASRRRVR
jgi:peptidoglycan/LPS O-acetylase OafA/YrhL